MIFKYHKDFDDRVEIGKPLKGLTAIIDCGRVVLNEPIQRTERE